MSNTTDSQINTFANKQKDQPMVNNEGTTIWRELGTQSEQIGNNTAEITSINENIALIEAQLPPTDPDANGVLGAPYYKFTYDFSIPGNGTVDEHSITSIPECNIEKIWFRIAEVLVSDGGTATAQLSISEGELTPVIDEADLVGYYDGAAEYTANTMIRATAQSPFITITGEVILSGVVEFYIIFKI